MAVEAGTRVGRFVIHEYLGQGDLGLLFRARGPNATSVAVKVLRSLSGARVRARFVVLARRLAGIRHPNLVSVLDFGEHDDAPYLVLQYLPGGSLADLLRTSTISQPGALWVLRGIAAGIDHAHHSGLVHGALKPQQVVLDDSDHPLVTDFGLTPLTWPRPDGVTVAVPQRNADYTAPELLTGGQPTSAADRYAYATMAYELLTGRTPFLGEPHHVMNAQLDAEPPRPSAVNPALTPDLDAVLLRGLAKDPRGRWQTCAEMAEALACAIRPVGPLPAAGRDAAPARTQRAARRHAGRPPGRSGRAMPSRVVRWPLGLVGALIAGALLVAGTVAWQSAQPRTAVIVLSADSVHAGDQLQVTATNLPAQQAGMIELHSDPQSIGTFKADRTGTARTDVLVPGDAPAGDHVITLCWDQVCHGAAAITIEDGAAPTLPPEPLGQGQIDIPVIDVPGGASPDPRRGHAGGPSGSPGVPGGSPPGARSPSPSSTPRPRRSPTPLPSHSPRPSKSPRSPKSPSASPGPSPAPGPTPPPPPPTPSPSPSMPLMLTP